MGKLLNVEYSCVHGAYWMFYGVISSFASVFLLAKGYTNWEIGVTLAVANVFAVVMQPVIADFADRAKKISLIGITQILTLAMMATTAGLFIIREKNVGLSAIFVLLIAWHTVLRPLFNSLAFKLEETGIAINFGIARSVGSLAYAALVAVLGTLVERYGISVLPITGEAILIMLLISLILVKRCADKSNKTSIYADPSKKEIRLKDDNTQVNMLQFIKRNKVFVIINIGVIGLYFSNSILNNYMMQIVDMVGGNSADMGRILSLMAFCEIPTMVCFGLLKKKFSYQLMIKVGAIGFTIKIAMCFIARSVAMIFAAQLFQLIAFALFLPAMVHFINDIMSEGEAVKGQALFTTMVTVTTVFSSLIGGAILDISGPRILTFAAAVVTAIGAVIIIIAIDKVKYK